MRLFVKAHNWHEARCWRVNSSRSAFACNVTSGRKSVDMLPSTLCIVRTTRRLLLTTFQRTLLNVQVDLEDSLFAATVDALPMGFGAISI